jgi:hypothetical protein
MIDQRITHQAMSENVGVGIATRFTPWRRVLPGSQRPVGAQPGQSSLKLTCGILNPGDFENLEAVASS